MLASRVFQPLIGSCLTTVLVCVELGGELDEYFLTKDGDQDLAVSNYDDGEKDFTTTSEDSFKEAIQSTNTPLKI